MDYYKAIAVALLLISGISFASPFPDDDEYESSLYESKTKSRQTVQQVPVESEVTEFKSLPSSLKVKDEEYRLGVGDLVSVKVFQVDELDHKTHVNSAGNVTLPLIGAVHIAGLKVQEAEKLISDKLSENYLQDPYVTLVIEAYESQKVTIEGWINKPGIYSLKGKMSLLQVIATGGGVNKMGDPTEVTIFRELKNGQRVGYLVDLEEVREGKLKDPQILNKDIVVVPEHGGKAAWQGVSQFLRFTPITPF